METFYLAVTQKRKNDIGKNAKASYNILNEYVCLQKYYYYLFEAEGCCYTVVA